jgi:type II restriction/modification system DNA methylase subunit YeeA
MEEKNAVANFYRASAEDFKKIPGSPIAYWIKNTDLFQFRKMQDNFFSGGRNKTHNNEKYLRNWWEINISTTKWKV